ncbi:MAG TPA: carbohydrate kinase [Prevotella sp.]
MRKIIGIGETILDIIFKGGQPTAAVPGGSTFNAMVSLGRSGLDATLISETGNDRVGEVIINFLKANGVNADYINVFPDRQSPISLAFLDENNDADYLFYKDHPHDRTDFKYPDVHADDIVLFGSFYAVNPVIRPQVAGFLEYARSRGAVIYYDVNFRPSHVNDIMRITPNLLENLEFADFVRGSHEDFKVLYKMDDPDKVYTSEIAFYCKKFIYTHGGLPIVLRTEGNARREYPVHQAQTVSTIGAGDNFNAGFIYGLMKYGIGRADIDRGLTTAQWDEVMNCALNFSADCCAHLDNYVSEQFGARMKEELNK